MMVENLIGLAVVLGLVIYLIVVLIDPERF